LATDEFLAIV